MDPAYAFEKPGNIALSKPAMFLTASAFNIPDGPMADSVAMTRDVHSLESLAV